MSASRTISSTDFTRLYLHYHRRMQLFAYRYVRNMSVAEDIVSDSFLGFYENSDKLTNKDNLPAYILTIVRNKCLNYLRLEKRKLEIEKKIHTAQNIFIQDSIMSLEACNPERIFSEEISGILSRSLDSMPELTRSIFIGIRQEGLSYKEIAATHKISTIRVDHELRKATKILRLALADFLCLLFFVAWLF